ncbi:CIC11C00000002371 [Sungouiella intermedia]|uniref:CIC11C00000002371 n=1 Tax=Sungouiella intermedia TaxID=45354 RepID=A0A1L0BEJ2_9ASCO|nr:CIC11C00000002371 [[Candida] intermedia]
MDGILKLEHTVPKLPVPLLASTVNQILAALKPLLTAEEYSEILEEASQFLANDAIKLIQEHLEAAASLDDVKCYLNSVNGELYPGVYGDLRGDTLPRNPYLVLEEDPYAMTINPPNQAQRAASLVNSSLKFMVTMRNGTLKPDVTPKSGKLLTMNCYRNLFGTTRIPQDSDFGRHMVTIKKYTHFNDSRHILFICNNQFFTLEVLTECTDETAECKHRLWFNDAELATIIHSIIEEALSVDLVASVTNGVGAITTQTYHHWKSARAELENSNKDALSLIDDALMVVVLDTVNSPVTDQEKTMVISHGTSELLAGTNIQIGSCTSRWYDKLQLVVTKNAVAGVVWESSSMDSTAILRFISDIYTDSILKLARNINGAENTLFDPTITFASGKESKPDYVPLIFNKTPELQNLVHLSETRLADLINQHEYKTLTMKLDSHLLSKFGILTDSFLQIGFQIANYALYGRIANTMEPITTRKFRDARTELIAVQNDLIANLVKMYITSDDDLRKWNGFKACCEIHTAQYRDAMAGKGFERHFTALVHILLRPEAHFNLTEETQSMGLKPIPSQYELAKLNIPFITNEHLEKLTGAELLISNCGNPALRLFGIPPSLDQGFGIGYIIHKDKVVVTISSKYRQTERFLKTFKSVVRGIKDIVKQKSDVLLDSADSESRKLELKKLRIEKELLNVNKHLSSTRHPIDISVSSNPLSAHVDELVKNEIDAGSGSDDNKEEDFSYLGGYGYFDMGEVTLRSDEISRNESFMNSHSSVGSGMTSRSESRHHSALNLHQLGKQHAAAPNDLRLKLSEKIRDQLSGSANGLNVSLDQIVSLERTDRHKSQIGRELEMK